MKQQGAEALAYQRSIEEPEYAEAFEAPETRYFQSKEKFDEAVGEDFIRYANEAASSKQKFLVGLSHGESPSGAYQFIFDHYLHLSRPELVYFTFVNSPLVPQRNMEGVFDAAAFIKKLLKAGLIDRSQILGTNFDRENLEQYAADFNQSLGLFLKQNNKEGFDYVFLVTNPDGRVAGITRNSPVFSSEEISAIVEIHDEKEMTMTPHFLKRSARIAFLATKADKRRPLAWLYARWCKENESPSFLRHIENVNERMTVFVDDKALTWPQVEVYRETPYGPTTIRVDLARPYDETAKKKLPVVLLIHGFLGLNSYDGLLTAIPSHKYIAAAMHYGSVPSDLPPSRYSRHIVNNIDAVVAHFGSKGHPVYIFDHSMGNIYFLMIDRQFNELKGIQKYLRGRIGANPFFGEEAKHALLGFMDNVLIPSVSFGSQTVEKAMFLTTRRLIPLDSRKGVRKRGIQLTDWLIAKDSTMRDRVWKRIKERILYLMAKMDSLPHLNRVPIEKALNKLPAKLFAIQIHSALEESKIFDTQQELQNVRKHGIPVMILKSEKDIVARYVPRIYADSDVEVRDITNNEETDLFREHLYHMINPMKTAQIIDDFIRKTETGSAK